MASAGCASLSAALKYASTRFTLVVTVNSAATSLPNQANKENTFIEPTSGPVGESPNSFAPQAIPFEASTTPFKSPATFNSLRIDSKTTFANKTPGLEVDTQRFKTQRLLVSHSASKF